MYGPCMYGPSWLCAEFAMCRVCYEPSLSCAEFLCAELSLNPFYEKALNHKSKPRTSKSSALPVHRIYFNSKYPRLSEKKKKKKKKKKKNSMHSVAFLFCFNSKCHHFNFLCVKIMEKWSQDFVDIMY